jgi:hypothetical protein
MGFYVVVGVFYCSAGPLSVRHILPAKHYN